MSNGIEGVGVGLRPCHFEAILSQNHDDIWFEILADNFLIPGGLNKKLLLEVCDRYPVVLHSVGLSLGGVHPLDWNYIDAIKGLKDATGSIWYSEHLSFSGDMTYRVPDLLPLPYTEEAVQHVVRRIEQVQERLCERILIENVSSYLQFPNNEMTEVEFVSEVATRADCDILLDINNIFVSSSNHRQDVSDCFDIIPADKVKQIHLAGYEAKEGYLLDSHNHPVTEPVWDLFKHYIDKVGSKPTLIEWDSNMPSFQRLLSEQTIAQTLLHERSG
jgi:uncharacterized protein (UPF0276 family)